MFSLFFLCFFFSSSSVAFKSRRTILLHFFWETQVKVIEADYKCKMENGNEGSKFIFKSRFYVLKEKSSYLQYSKNVCE